MKELIYKLFIVGLFLVGLNSAIVVYLNNSSTYNLISLVLVNLILGFVISDCIKINKNEGEVKNESTK